MVKKEVKVVVFKFRTEVWNWRLETQQKCRQMSMGVPDGEAWDNGPF